MSDAESHKPTRGLPPRAIFIGGVRVEPIFWGGSANHLRVISCPRLPKLRSDAGDVRKKLVIGEVGYDVIGVGDNCCRIHPGRKTGRGDLCGNPQTISAVSLKGSRDSGETAERQWVDSPTEPDLTRDKIFDCHAADFVSAGERQSVGQLGSTHDVGSVDGG